jgi:hypothetical protein
MKFFNAYTYYALGHSVGGLPWSPTGRLTPEGLNAIAYAAKSLEEFVNHEEKERLRGSVKAADNLISQLKRAVSDALTGVQPFDNEAIARIESATLFFNTTLGNEMMELPLFCVEKKGSYSLSALIMGAGNEQPAVVKAKAPITVTDELSRSGVCLAYSCPTASAFHALRALELLVTELISKLNLPPAPLNRCNWGEYIQILRNGNAPKEVTDLLQIIKDNYRNPIMHPDDTLDIEQATSLFGICQSALEVICRHIP